LTFMVSTFADAPLGTLSVAVTILPLA